MMPNTCSRAVLAGLFILALAQGGSATAFAATTKPAAEGVCTLLSEAELHDAFGKDMHIAPELSFYPTSMACTWSAAAEEDGYLSVFILPGDNLEAPTASDTYKPVEDVGTKGFIAEQLGGWVAGALVGQNAVRIQADGSALTEAAAIGLLKLAVEHAPELIAKAAAAAPPAPAPGPHEPTVCERLPASEMSAILGVEVVATGEDRPGKHVCTYSKEGTFLYVELEFAPGDGAAGMAGAGMAMQAEPGLADPLAGIGDQAVQAGPMLLIRRGEDLITLTLSGVDEDWATVAKAVLARGQWPEAVAASGDQPKGAAAPEVDLPGIPDRLGGIPGVRDLLAALTGQKPPQPPEAPPSPIAEAFAQPASLDQPCPSGGPAAESEIAAEAGALVPMKPGTTLSYVWTWQGDNFDHECLDQVTAVGADAVTITNTCPMGEGQPVSTGRREVCRADMRDSLVRETKIGPGMPETIGGATYLSLSRAAFRTLKAEGAVWHRYLELPVPNDDSADDLRGRIARTSTGTVRTIINDKVVDLPVIFAEGTLTREPYDGVSEAFKMTVLDDENVPLLLDYGIPGLSFRINFTKITYPAADSLEQQLAADQPVDIYGIYFDFNSDALRPESAPVLAEIAGVLRTHPDWKLGVDGHTDSIGDDAFNLDLSKRRASAVKAALAADYGIDPERLQTDGHGATQPKESNATPEGRARNRRVELRRL